MRSTPEVTHINLILLSKVDSHFGKLATRSFFPLQMYRNKSDDKTHMFHKHSFFLNQILLINLVICMSY